MSPATNSSVDQVFDVLSLLSGSVEPTGVAQLARAIGVPTSTAHRVLATLEEAGYVERDTTGTKYQLGLGAHELAHALLRRFPLQAASVPILRRLASATGETAVLNQRVGFYVVRVACAEGTSEVRAAPRLGQARQLEDTPGGRAMLATLDDALQTRYVRWRAGGGPRTASARALRAELDTAGEDGYVLEAHEDGSADLSVALRGSDAQATGSITVEAYELGGARAAKARLVRLRASVQELEALLRERPELAFDPFGHVEPEELSPGFQPVA
jgi:DNA-binding IclR family transcriptional regulator